MFSQANKLFKLLKQYHHMGMYLHGQGKCEVNQFGSNIILDQFILAKTCLMLIHRM